MASKKNFVKYLSSLCATTLLQSQAIIQPAAKLKIPFAITFELNHLNFPFSWTGRSFSLIVSGLHPGTPVIAMNYSNAHCRSRSDGLPIEEHRALTSCNIEEAALNIQSSKKVLSPAFAPVELSNYPGYLNHGDRLKTPQIFKVCLLVRVCL